jgi:hypothetical protein
MRMIQSFHCVLCVGFLFYEVGLRMANGPARLVKRVFQTPTGFYWVFAAKDNEQNTSAPHVKSLMTDQVPLDPGKFFHL